MADNTLRFNDFLVRLTRDVAVAHTEMQSLQRMAWAETVVHYQQQAAADREDEIKQIRAEVLSEWNNMVDLAIDEVKLSFYLSKRSWFARTWGRIRHPSLGKQPHYQLSTQTGRHTIQTVQITIRRNDEGILQANSNLQTDKPENDVQVPPINE